MDCRSFVSLDAQPTQKLQGWSGLSWLQLSSAFFWRHPLALCCRNPATAFQPQLKSSESQAAKRIFCVAAVERAVKHVYIVHVCLIVIANSNSVILEAVSVFFSDCFRTYLHLNVLQTKVMNYKQMLLDSLGAPRMVLHVRL